VNEARLTAKVLIVDADPAKLQALRAALTTAAYHVTSATSASFALTTLERDRPDLIVSGNRTEDMARGIDFFPPGYTAERLAVYARDCLERAEAYALTVPSRAFLAIYQIPLKLAFGTLDAIARGEAKLTREAVIALVAEADGQS